MIIRWTVNSVAALLLLMGIWWLLQQQTVQAPAQMLQVRELQTVTLPPPPPPPPPSQTQLSEAATIELSLALGQMALQVTDLKVTMPKLAAPNAMSPAPLESTLHFDTAAFVTAMTTFRLDELDDMPKLLTPITARLPASLRQKGVRQAQIQLHVIIHENGQVELVAINQSRYPEMNALIPKIIKQARFTSPTREGIKVKAEFLWPLKVAG